ncbi:MAG: rod shape-determining protein MreC [Ruminococcaceae bacterium]|nr:rod shape-determining protein MreC [Oscillospiraceae bacterium]
MRHFFSTRIRVVLTVVALVAVILTVISSLTGTNVPNMLVKGIMTPLRTGVSKLASGVENIYDYIFSYEALAAENEDLKQQLAQMQDNARVADAVSRENQRLRALLDLASGNEDYSLADGYIISWDSTEWSSTFTINRGANVGIAVDMCAVTANGELVGLVTEVGPNYAVVKTVLDSSLEISATIATSGYNGMVKGGYTVNLPDKLRMNYLDTDSTIHINDQVVTTGSVVYPRGLIVGNVIDAGFDDTGVAKYAILEPAADIGSLEQVFIITEFNVG